MEAYSFPVFEISETDTQSVEDLQKDLRDYLHDHSIKSGFNGTDSCFEPVLDILMSCSQVELKAISRVIDFFLKFAVMLFF